MNIQIENRLNGDTVTLEKIKNKGSDELIKSEGFLELGHENDKHDDNMNIDLNENEVVDLNVGSVGSKKQITDEN